MLFHSFYLLASLTFVLSQGNPNPVVGGDPDNGWHTLPEVMDATAYPDWDVGGGSLPIYQTSGVDNENITRAVIVLPGRNRDCWFYWNVVNNALSNATRSGAISGRDGISIMGPCFFTQPDMKAGAAHDGQMIWGATTWVSGHESIASPHLSSFAVLDALVDYYMDTRAYPNLRTVVIAGHSAGAQMTQRYAALRRSIKNDDRLHFWIANPGSLCWLTRDRPFPNSTCGGVDDYKYGLSGRFPGYSAGDVARKGVTSRYNGRNVHYAWGLKDNGPGDTRCEALTQGSTHLERGRNFVAMLEGLEGSLSPTVTVDWVEGVSHSNEDMMNSEAGINKLFLYDDTPQSQPLPQLRTSGATKSTISWPFYLGMLAISSILLLRSYARN